MSFSNMLGFWGWSVLATVPALIVLLYFLKLRRHPVEVPSTFLWTRTIEDLHVNSIWQRLRRSLLLFLQLLLLALIIIACLRPGWQGAQLTGNRFILLIDTSASMGATDQGEARLEIAKRRAREVIDQMESGEVAMIISFSDEAKIEQSFTDNRGQLRSKLANIQLTHRGSDLDEALRAAAGLANPGRTSEAENLNDYQVADAKPASLFIFSDGGVAEVPEFALEHLSAEWIPIGNAQQVNNIGIVAFAVGENPENAQQVQAFARVESFSEEPAEIALTLYLNGQVWDAKRQIEVSQQQAVDLTFDLGSAQSGVPTDGILRLELEYDDDYRQDNTAWAALQPSRPARVLVVTPGNEFLEIVLTTRQVTEHAVVETVDPGYLKSETYQQQAIAGAYDIVIFDRCAPEEMPIANTLFIGQIPPVEGWKAQENQGPVLVIDDDQSHPVMHMIVTRDILAVEGTAIEGPPGTVSLMDTNLGSMLAIGPRGGFQDMVLGFPIVTRDAEGVSQPNTNWPRLGSYPPFFHNLIRYLSNRLEIQAAATIQPGQPVTIRSNQVAEQVSVSLPDGETRELVRGPQNQLLFHQTDNVGVYQVRTDATDTPFQQFAVNLMDRQESDIRLSDRLKIGYEEVAASTQWETARVELWKWILIGGLVVLLIEWYVYNRRVLM